MPFPINLHADILGVNHYDLDRLSPQSDYRSICPADGCDGVLPVQRDATTFKLKAKDRCSSCAQQVVYIDIKRMQEDLG